jgi:predicted nucleotidyltransferase
MGVAQKKVLRDAIGMSVAELPIPLDRERIAAFCRARGIRKLSLFGSVLREDFDPARSDVDVLAEFAPGVRPGLKFFGYGEELAGILGWPVDFNTATWLSPYFRDEVVREALPVYEQA